MDITPDFSRPGLTQQMMGAEDFQIPVSILTGRLEGPTIVLAAGVHGGEYGAILTLMELARELNPADIKGRLIMLHPVNTQGFSQRRATVLPADGVNINQSFPGDLQGGPAARLASLVTGFQDTADFYLDLHTADLFEETAPLACYPATGSPATTAASRQAARVLQVPYVIKSSLAGAGITSAAARGIAALLIKRGGRGGSCPRREVDLYKKDVLNLLRYLKALPGEPELPPQPPQEVRPHYVRSRQAGCWLSRVGPGQPVQAGERLGELTDFFGQTLATFTAETQGVVLYQLQALSAQPGDILLVY